MMTRFAAAAALLLAASLTTATAAGAEPGDTVTYNVDADGPLILAGFTAAIPIGRLAAPDEGAPAVGSCQYSGWLDRQYRAAGRRQCADVGGSPARQGVCGR